jgi:hypothetical protein
VVLTEHLEVQELLELLLNHLELLPQEEPLGLVVHREHPEHRLMKEHQELLELQVHLLDLQVQVEHPEPLELRVHLELTQHPELPVNQLEHREHPVPLVKLEPLELRVFLG